MKLNSLLRSHRAPIICAGSIALLAAASVESSRAADGTWVNATSGGLWSDGANWAGGILADGSGFTADFNTLDLLGDNTVNMDAPHTLTNLIFGDTDTATAGSWIVGNNALATNILTLAGVTPTITVNALGAGKSATISAVVAGTNGLTKAGVGTLVLSGANTYSGGTILSAGTLSLGANAALGTGAFTINAGTTIDASVAVTATNALSLGGNFSFAGSSALILNGAATLTGSRTITTTANTLTLGGIVGDGGGAFGLTKAGTGTLALNAANTYSGGTTLNAGTLRLGANAALGTGTFTINDGTTIDSSVAVTATNALNLGGNFTFTGTSTLNLNGAATLTGSRTITTTANILTLGGVVGDGGGSFGLTKAGAGTLTLTGANTFSGGTTLGAGTLRLGANAALGTGGFTINDATTLDATVAVTATNALNLGGNFTFTGTSTLNLNGAATLTGSRTITTTASTLTLGGNIGDGGSAFGLTKAGAGTLTLTGANTFSGGVILNGGILRLGANAALGTGNFTINDATTVDSTVAVTAANALTLGGNFTFTGTNALSLNGATTLTGSRSITVVANTLTLGGNIGDGGGGFGLTKAGAGTLTLGGANTFSGGTTLSAGTLRLAANSALGTGALTINDATTLDASVAVTAANAVNLAGNFIFTGTNALSLNGAALLTGSRTITTLASNLTLGGVVGDGGLTLSLTKAGAGTLTLAGANTYAGGTTATGGTLALGTATSLGTGALSISGGTLLDANAPLTVANALNIAGDFGFVGTNALTLSGTVAALAATRTITVNASKLTLNGDLTEAAAGFGLTKAGAGTLTLTGNNSYTGPTIINAGNIAFASPTSIAGTTANVTVATGAAAVANYAIDQAFLSRIAPASTGAVALGADSANNLDFGIAGANLTGVSLGAMGNFTYSGLLTPSGTTYRVGGGGGVLTLANANALTGAADVAVAGPGTVILAQANDFSGALTLTGGGILNAGTFNYTLGAVTLTSGTINGSGVVTGTSYAVQSGAISPSLAGPGGLAKSGAGTVTLTGTNTYAGPTTITGGVLAFGSPASIAGSGANVTLNNTGGTNATAAVNYAIDQAFLGRIDPASTGAVALGADSSNALDLTAANLNLSLGSSGNFTYSGTLTPFGATYQLGGGTGALTLSSVNALTGARNVVVTGAAGSVVLGASNDFSGGLAINTGALALGAANVLPDAGSVTLAGGTLNLNTFNDTVGALTLTGGTITGTTGVLTATSYAVQAGTIAGRLSGSGALTKTTAGVATLIAPATYTGGTNVSAGTLTLGAADVLPDTGPVTVATGGTLSLLTFNDTIERLTLTGGTVSGGTSVLTAPLFDVQAGTISAILGGTGRLLKTTTGTVTLTGANTYTGSTIINAGTLAVNGAQPATASFILNDGATMTSNQQLTATNVILGGTGTSNYTNSVASSSTVGHKAVLGGNGNITFSIGNNTTITDSFFSAFGGVAKFNTTNGLRFQANINSPFATLDFAATTGAIYTRDARTMVIGGIQGGAATGGILSNSVGGASTYIIGSVNADTTYTGQFGSGGALNASSLVKVGSGTLTISRSAVFQSTGAYSVNGGTLKVDYSGLPTGILNATSLLNFGGGTLALLGKSTGTTTQTLGNVTLNAGGGRLVVDPNGGSSTTLTLGTLTLTAAGGSLNIQPPSVAVGAGSAVVTTTTPKNAPGIYGGRVTYGSDWATTNSAGPVYTLAAYSGYTTFVGTGGDAATNYALSDSGTVTAAESFNSFKITTTGGGNALDLGGTALTLNNGGLLFAGADNYTIGVTAGDQLKSNIATNSDLIVHQLGSGNLTIAAVIANGNGAQTLTKAGSGTLTLTGTNTYTGQTFLNGGVTSIGANANLGAAATGAQLNLSGGTLQATATFALDNAGANLRAVGIGGAGGTFDVTGANNLTVGGVVTNLVGSQFGPLIKTGTGILTLTGANTYSGTTRISGGVLSVASLAAGGATSAIGNSISAAPALVLDGGTLRYTGGAQITNRAFTLTANGGGLDASGAGNAALTFSNTLPVVFSGTGARTLNLSGSSTGNNTLAAIIGDGTNTTGASGKVGVNKSGAGKWVLTSADHTYTGNTTVSSGTLALAAASTNSIASSSIIAVSPGATLDVSGLTGGSIVLGGTQTLTGGGSVLGGVNSVSGSTLDPGSAGVGTLTVGTLSLATGTILDFEFQAGGANDLFNVTGLNGLTLSTLSGGAGGGLNLFQAGTVNKLVTTGAYSLFQYSGTVGGAGIGALTSASILNPQFGLTYAFDTTTNPGFVTLVVGGTTALIAQWTSLADGNWSSGPNWSTNPQVPSIAGQTANFTTTQSALRTVTLDGSETVGSITFDSTPGGYLIAPGTGTLTLDNSGSPATVTVNNGAHTIAAPVRLTSNVIVLTSHSADTLTISGNIGQTAGTPTLTKNGAGTLVLTGTNTYGPAKGTVGTILNAGTVQVGSNTALAAGDLAVTADATLRAGADGLTVDNDIVATGGTTTTVDTQTNTFTLTGLIHSLLGAPAALRKSGVGMLKITGNNTYTGTTTINQGTLQLGDAGTTGSVAGDILNNAALVSNRSDDYALGNIISGTGNFTQSGTGNTTLSAANTFSGETKITAGILTLGTPLALQSSTLNYGSFGGTLSFGALAAATLGNLTGSQDLALMNTAATPAAVALTVGNTANTTYSGALSGAGSLAKRGSGTLTLTGNNSYIGATSVTSGTLEIATGGTVLTSSIGPNGGRILVNGGTLTQQGTTTSTVVGAGFLQTSGTSTFAGILQGNQADGNLIRIEGGTFTGPELRLQRTGTIGGTNGTVAPPDGIPATPISQNLGIVVLGGTVNVGLITMGVGTGNSNSSSTAYFGGGNTTVTGQVTIGHENNSRWNYLQVAGGTFTSTDPATGIVIGRAGTSIQSELYLTGGVTTAQRIAFGTAADTVGGTANLVLNGGTLYVGTSGIVTANPVGLVTNTILTAGTLGAATDWTTTQPMLLNGASTSAFTIKAADAADLAHNISLNGILSGTAILNKTGTGDLLLSAANTRNGDTKISNGTLTLANALALQSSTLDYNNYDLLALGTPGTLHFGLDILTSQFLTTATLGGLKGAQNLELANDGPAPIALRVGGNNQSTTYTGILGDATAPGGSLTKQGTGTLTLTGASTYSGGTTVNAGILAVNGSAALGTGAANVTLNTGAVLAATSALDQTLVNRVTSTSTGQIALGVDSANNLDLSAAGANLPTVSLGATGAAIYSGTLTPNGGTYRLGGGGGVLTEASALTGANSLVVSSGGFAASQVVLAAANNYTGPTTVESGKLVVSGSLSGTSGVEVNTGAALLSGATGAITTATGGNINLTGSAHLTPGGLAAAGTFTFTLDTGGKLNFASGSTLDFNLGTTSDLMAFGTLGDSLAGGGAGTTLALSPLAGFSTSATYTVFSNVTTPGFAFGTITGYDAVNFLATFQQVGNDYVLGFVAVPEPSVGLMLLSGLGLLPLRRRRRPLPRQSDFIKTVAAPL